jgi:pimeloyl-ACP methyl ester carboxylesterase
MTQIKQIKLNELKFIHTLLCVFMITFITLSWTTVVVHAQEGENTMESLPTIVLVHGAFAESASWNGVIRELQHSGYPVIALANPLRGIASDAAYTQELLKTIEGPIVLVGHSYGGAIINSAAVGNPNVRALVFVAAFAPEKGEALGELNGHFPGSTLTETLLTVPLANSSNDVYIQQDKYHQQFAADVPAEEAAQMAVTQRPIVDGAFTEERPLGRPFPLGSSLVNSIKTFLRRCISLWRSGPRLETS